MGSVYRFAFFSFLSFIFAVNLASTYKEIAMEDLELRETIMNFILFTLRDAYDDIPESDIEAISDIDAMLCKRLGLDIDNIPPFD